MALTKRTYTDQVTVITAQNLNDIQDEIIANGQNIGKHNAAFADEYSSSSTYSKGDFCTYQDELYKCKADISTAEAWTAAHWDKVTVGEELSTSGHGVYFSDVDATTAALAVSIPGITELVNGLQVKLRMVGTTSETSGLTLNINGLGAKNVYKVKNARIYYYDWDDGQVCEFVYYAASDRFYMVDSAHATLERYGITTLYDDEGVDYSDRAATPKAVNKVNKKAKATIGKTPYDSTSPTTRSFSSGTCIIYNSKLYRAASAIASGDTLTPGTNIIEISNIALDGNIGDLSSLSTTAKGSLVLAVCEVDGKTYSDMVMIAPEYDPTETYAKGAFCSKDHVLYKSNQIIGTPEAWTAAHWDATNVVSEMGSGGGGGGDASSGLIAEQYDATSAYSVGDYCIHNNILFRCNTAIASGGEAWTVGHWDSCSVATELEALNDRVADFDEMSGIACQDTAPTGEVKWWLDTDGDPIVVPEIDDEHTNGVDTWSSNKINDEVNELGGDVGIVVEGKRPKRAVTSGQYVIVRNSTISGITDGLYTANTGLSTETDVVAANLTEVTGGGLNHLKNTIDTITDLNSLITWNVSGVAHSALKIGRVVIINFRTGNAQNVNTTLFTLPSDYIPYVLKNNLYQNDDTMYFPVASYDNSVTGAQIAVKKTGVVVNVGRGLPAYSGGNIVYVV